MCLVSSMNASEREFRPSRSPLHHTSQVIPVGAPALSLPVLDTQMYKQPFSGPPFRRAASREGALLLPHYKIYM